METPQCVSCSGLDPVALIDEMVKEYGFAVVPTSFETEDGDMLEFAYTIGLQETLNHPEIILFGLPAGVAHKFLIEVFHRIKTKGPVDVDIPILGMAINNYPTMFKKISPENIYEFMKFSVGRNGADMKALQMIYTDRNFKWPWDPECIEDVKKACHVLEESK